jgi:hypothetical protein
MARRRDESEIKWVRQRKTVNAATVTGSLQEVSDWHAVVPDIPTVAPPGVACGTPLPALLQWESPEGVKGREGGVCVA